MVGHRELENGVRPLRRREILRRPTREACRGAARLLLVVLAGIAGNLSADEPPTFETVVERPVIQELMGGCSLTCAFPWSAQGPETGGNGIAAINDARVDTAWTGIRPGDRITFRFPENLPRDLDGTPFYGVDIANGRLIPRQAFKNVGRVKAFRLFHNGKVALDVQLADTPRWQTVSFPDILLNVGDTLAIEILEVEPGRKDAAAAITELVLQGAH